jgi:hypothetical protein
MSCYFDSLSYFFQVDRNLLRREICNYLESNRPLFDDIETKVILNEIDSQYIAKMRLEETWAGAIEISASCNLWNIVIVVHNSQLKPIVFEPLNKKPKHVIHLHWTGNHYEPFVPKQT